MTSRSSEHDKVAKQFKVSHYRGLGSHSAKVHKGPCSEKRIVSSDGSLIVSTVGITSARLAVLERLADPTRDAG